MAVLDQIFNALGRGATTLAKTAKSVTKLGKTEAARGAQLGKWAEKNIKNEWDDILKRYSEGTASLDDISTLVNDRYANRGFNQLTQEVEKKAGGPLSNIQRARLEQLYKQDMFDQDLASYLPKGTTSEQIADDFLDFFKSDPVNAKTAAGSTKNGNRQAKDFLNSAIDNDSKIQSAISNYNSEMAATNAALEAQGIDVPQASGLIKTKEELPSLGDTIIKDKYGKTIETRDGIAKVKAKIGEQYIQDNPWDTDALEKIEQLRKDAKNGGMSSENPWSGGMRAALGTAVGGAALLAAINSSRGQQNNAQLYGQQPLY